MFRREIYCPNKTDLLPHGALVNALLAEQFHQNHYRRCGWFSMQYVLDSATARNPYFRPPKTGEIVQAA
jgi:hypothetical protein